MDENYFENEDTPKSPTKHLLMKFLWGIGIIAIIAGSGFVFWDKYNLNDQIEAKQSAIATLEKTKADRLKKKGYNEAKAIDKAKSVLTLAKSNRVDWVPIYRDLSALEDGVTLNLKTINGDEHLSFNIEGQARQMSSIAQLLIKIKTKPQFKKVFISQISEKNNKEQISFSFHLSFDYVPVKTTKSSKK